MAAQDSAMRRQRKLASYHRRVGERRERGLCVKCGKCPPAPDRSICVSCNEKARAAERARAERLRAEGKPVRDPDATRRADRERDRRQHAERKAAGLCVKCGRAPALPERTQCEPCAEKRLAADRARHARARAEGKPRRDSEAARLADRERGRRRRAERRAAGMCIRCGAVAPEEGRSMCEPCREDRRAAKRARRAERRAAGLCRKCAAPVTGGAAYCAPCATVLNERRQRNPEAHREPCSRKHREDSGAFRGIPIWDPSWTVIEIATGRDLGTYDSEMEVAACLAFAKLSRDEVEVIADASPMASFTAPPWW